MSKKLKNKPKKDCRCETCANLIAIGEGDHICTDGDEPRIVIDGYEPANDYLWCRGRLYCE